MNTRNKIFTDKKSQHGSMLVELLLSIALAVAIIPFIFQYQQNAITRAENIAIANQMSDIQTALERYIVANRAELLNTVGKSITRVNLSDLVDFGVSTDLVDSGDEKYQLRILKSSDFTGQSTLQGVVVRSASDITPLRTREIVSLGGGNMGFIDGTHAYGTYGAWHTDTVDMGVNATDGIVGTTTISRDNSLYLWRVPSDDASDSTMMSALNLGGHNIVSTQFFDTRFADFGEMLSAQKIVSKDIIFQNRTTLDQVFHTNSAVVSGILSADARNMDITGGLTLADIGKFSSLTAQNMWVANMTLGGISIEAEDDLATLKINQSLDMTAGHISALFVTVGFTGSVTPRLVVGSRIEDSVNSAYYWDVSSKTAHFSDVSFAELNRLATMASYYESDASTVSTQIFGAVSANKNATAADFMNAITEIQKRVRAKYRLLKLE